MVARAKLGRIKKDKKIAATVLMLTLATPEGDVAD